MKAERTVLELEGIGKAYGSRAVLEKVSLEVRAKERFFIIGPSGCGKTTLLRIIAGLAGPHRGRVAIDGDVVAGEGVFVPPHKRRVGFVFQDGALWPHLTVEQHLYFAREARRNREWTEKILNLTGLSHRRRDYPHMLSGGEFQRIALARALSARPRLLLLDEPLRNLDRNLARDMRGAIAEILDALETTAVFVTHDQEEALSMAHRILLMDEHGPVQTGTPGELYNKPATPWAARFFGPVNEFRGRADGKGRVATSFGPVDTGLPPGTDCRVLFRPSQIGIAPAGEGTAAVVRGGTFLGSVTRLDLDAGDARLIAAVKGPPPEPGRTVGLVAVSDPLVFPEGGPES